MTGLDPVTFTATAKITPDFDGVGETGCSGFILFADAFGSSYPRFDLDGRGSVDFADFFLLADHFADPARGKQLPSKRLIPPSAVAIQSRTSPILVNVFYLHPGQTIGKGVRVA